MRVTGSRRWGLVAVAIGAAMLAGSARAQTAAPAPAANAPAATVADAPPAMAPAKKKPHKKPTPTVVVLVTNSRAVALTELDASAAGADPKPIVSNLAPGKKASVKVQHGESCLFDLHGAYADGSTTDSASVDFCKDKKVNLID
jgi:hypothetical protein